MDTLIFTDPASVTPKYTAADYAAIAAIAKRNGGIISKAEIFSVIVSGYTQFCQIVHQLEVDGLLKKGGYHNEIHGPSVNEWL